MTKNNSIRFNGIGFGGLLTIVFIALKLADIIDWSWWWVFAPIWAPICFMLLIMLFIGIVIFISVR